MVKESTRNGEYYFGSDRLKPAEAYAGIQRLDPAA